MFDEKEIKTRKCVKSDYDFIFKLIKGSIFPLVEAYYKPDENVFKKRFYKDYKERIILEIKNKPIGFYQIENSNNKLIIKGLFLIKEHRGKGIGKFLMEKLEKTGVKEIELNVWENNLAIKFYQSLGYKIIEEKDHKYLMRKIII